MVDLRQQDLVLICSFYYSFMYLDLEPYSEYGSRSIRQTNTGTVRIQSGPETLCACPEKKERERRCSAWAGLWPPPGSRGGCSTATSTRCSKQYRHVFIRTVLLPEYYQVPHTVDCLLDFNKLLPRWITSPPRKCLPDIFNLIQHSNATHIFHPPIHIFNF